jgi:hypothetical protein
LPSTRKLSRSLSQYSSAIAADKCVALIVVREYNGGDVKQVDPMHSHRA